MISLEKKQKVLFAIHQEDKSQRQIAKELGISRNTVKKYIQEDFGKRKLDIRWLPITDNYLSLRRIKNGREINVH